MCLPQISCGKGALEGIFFRPTNAPSSSGAFGRNFAIALHDGAGVLLVPGDRPGEHHLHRVQLEQEAGDDAEVAAAAAQRPQQVGVLLLAGGDEAAIGQHDIGLEQIVDGQAVLARQVAMPAAQRQAGDAGGRNDARRDGQAEGMGSVVDVALRAAGANAGRAGLGVDAHAFHLRQVDDQAIVHAAKARPVVAAAPDGDGQAVVAPEIDRGDHVGDVGAAGNGQWPLVDHAVVERACFLIAGVALFDDATA